MITVPEESTAWLTVTFKNKAGETEAPATAEYRVDTAEGDELREWTPISSPGGVQEITLTPSDNAISDDRKVVQTNVVTVHTTYGDDDERNESYLYQVRNLKQIPRGV